MAAIQKAPKAVGVDQVHVAKLVTDEEGSFLPSYGEVIYIPEIVQNSIKPQNYADKFYADNVLSEVFSGTTGAQVSTTMAGLEMASLAAIQGRKIPTEAGVLGDLMDDPSPVAYGYRRKIYGKTKDGRQKYRFVWLYKVIFVPPDEESNTQADKITVQPGQLSGETMGLDSFKPDHVYWQYTYDNWVEGASQELDDHFFDTPLIGLPVAQPEPEPDPENP